MQPTPPYSSTAGEIGSRMYLRTHLLWIVLLLTLLLPLFASISEIVGWLENLVLEDAWNVLATYFTSFLGYAYFGIQMFFYQFVDRAFGSSWMECKTLHCTVRVCFDPIAYKVYVFSSETTTFIGHVLFEFGHRTIQTFVSTLLCLITIIVLYPKFFKTTIAEYVANRAAEHAKLQEREFAKRWPRDRSVSILDVTLLPAGDTFATYLEKLWRSQNRSFTSDDIPLAAYKTYYWIADDAAEAATRKLRSHQLVKKSLPSSPEAIDPPREKLDNLVFASPPREKLDKPVFASPLPAIRRTIPWDAFPRISYKPEPARSQLKAQTVCKVHSPPVIPSAAGEPVRSTAPERGESAEVVTGASGSNTLPTNEEPEKKAAVEESVVVKNPNLEPVPQELLFEPTASKSDAPATAALTDVAGDEEPAGSAQATDNSSPIATAGQEKVELAEVAVKNRKDGFLNGSDEWEKKATQPAADADSIPVTTAGPAIKLTGLNDSTPCRSSRCNDPEHNNSSESEGVRWSGRDPNISSDGEISPQWLQKQMREIINPSPPRPRPTIQGHRATVLTHLSSPVAFVIWPVRKSGKRGGSLKSPKKTTKNPRQWESPIPLLKPGVISQVTEQFPESPSLSRAKLPLPPSPSEATPRTPVEIVIAEEQPKPQETVIVSECDPVWGDISALDRASERDGIEAVANQQEDDPNREMRLITFEAMAQAEELIAVPTSPSQVHGLTEQIVGSIMDELLSNDAPLPDALIPIDAIEEVSGEGGGLVAELVERISSSDKGKGRAIEDEGSTVCDVVPQGDAPLPAQQIAPPQNLSRNVLGRVSQAEVDETCRAAELDQSLQTVDSREGRSEEWVEPSTETQPITQSNVAIHAASEPNVDQTVDVQLLEAPPSVMAIQEQQGNADEEARDNLMDLSTEHDCPTSVTTPHHGAVMGNGSGEEAGAPLPQHQGQEPQSTVADESIATAIEEDEMPQLVAEEVDVEIVPAAADVGGGELDPEEVPIPRQETEVREMDVAGTDHHGHLQWNEEEVAAVMGRQTVGMPSAVEFAGAPEQVILPAPASHPLRPVKALPSRRPKPITTADETVSTAPLKVQSQGLYQTAPGIQPSELCTIDDAALDATIAMAMFVDISEGDIGGNIGHIKNAVAGQGNQVSVEMLWSQHSEASGIPPGGYSQPSWATVDKYTGIGFVGPDFKSYRDAQGYNAGQVQGGYYSSPVYSQRYSSSADDGLQALPIADTPFVKSSYSTLSGAVPPFPSVSYPTVADINPSASNVSSETFEPDLSDSMGLRSTAESHPNPGEQQMDGNQGDEVDESMLAALIDQTDSDKAQENFGHLSKKMQERILKNRKLGKKPPTKKSWDIQSKQETNPGAGASTQISFSGATTPPFASSPPPAIVPNQLLRPFPPPSSSSPSQTANQGSRLSSSMTSSFDVPSPSIFRFVAPVASSPQPAIPPPSMNQDWLDPSLRNAHLEHAHPNNLPYYAGYSEEALTAVANLRYSPDNVEESCQLPHQNRPPDMSRLRQGTSTF